MEHVTVHHTSVVVAFVIVLLTTVIYYFTKKRKVLPGPMGLPYLGLYFSLNDENIHAKLAEYKKKYGDLFSFTYTGRLFINMGSLKAMRELYINNSDCFQDKFTDCSMLTQMAGNGLLMANGERWKILRKFYIHKFRERGLNSIRDEMAAPVYDSLTATIEDLRVRKGTPVSVMDVLGRRCAVLIRKVIFGEEGVTDEELQSMCMNYSESTEGMLGVNCLLIGPFARLLYCVNPKLKRSLQKCSVLRDLLSSCAQKIERSMDEERPSCIIKDFYKERNQRRRNNDPTWEIFTDDALVESVLQFVGDGITSVAFLIGVLLDALIKHPEEQEKLHTELMEVIGPNRQPALHDRTNLPYVNAFVYEVLRDSSFLPIFPSLECTRETTIRGYVIPKGSITLFNFLSAHSDPEAFEEPDTFNPSRYLSVKGKPKPEHPVTFGIGKRTCTGEIFVMSQAFLFLTTIVKNFKIVSSNDLADKSLDFILTGKLKLIFHPRTESRKKIFCKENGRVTNSYWMK